MTDMTDTGGRSFCVCEDRAGHTTFSRVMFFSHFLLL